LFSSASAALFMALLASSCPRPDEKGPGDDHEVSEKRVPPLQSESDGKRRESPTQTRAEPTGAQPVGPSVDNNSPTEAQPRSPVDRKGLSDEQRQSEDAKIPGEDTGTTKQSGASREKSNRKRPSKKRFGEEPGDYWLPGDY
jgi:hypothetical protein